MWIKYDPNPCGGGEDDCAVRAISVVLGIEWDEAYVMLSNMGLMMCKIMNHNAVISGVLRMVGFNRSAISSDCPDCYTESDFCEDHPAGTYVLGTGKHVVAVISGDYIDSFDSGNEIPVYYYYRP